MSANSSPPQPETVLLACSKCGAPLPDEAQFCLKCGKAVSLPPRSAPIVEVLPPASPRAPRRKRRVLLWLILALFVASALWVATSDNPAAQSVQELVGFKHDQTILDTPFTVGPHTFRYYKFSLPEGSVNVEIAGEFSSTNGTPPAPARKAKDKKGKDQNDEPDNDIQVYVLSEPAFTIWQNGYATSSLYDSGKVSHGSVHGEVPAGAGIYYLVFNNKFAPKTAKSVRSTVVLRYKSWLPEWIRLVKERFSNWVEN